MALVHAGEAVAEALRQEGVATVYSVPGSHIHPIYDGLSRVPSIRLVTCKQESNVSLMADAYGRLTGKPGVCLVTAGPGGLNSSAGVAQAYGAASPMVHIGGAVPLHADLEAFHGVDNPAFVHEMFRHITKWSVRVERIEDIPAAMAKAFHVARSGRPGPVHVELPRVTDYSEHMLVEGKREVPAYERLSPVAAQPDARDVEAIAEALIDARFPVIAAGKGVMRKAAMEELSQLSLKLQAPVVFAQDAIGVISEKHPFFAGHFAHNRPHPMCKEALEVADVVLAVGLRAGAAEMTDLRERVRGRLILVGFDDGPNERYRGDDERVADPGLFLTMLLARMAKYQRTWDEQRVRHMAETKAGLRESLARGNAPHRAEQPIHPGVLMDAMNAVLGDDAVLASDVGNCQQWARTFKLITNAESFMQSGVWNAMSYALPTAMVAKMEFPQRDVVALVGDGAFLMTSGDLPTAAEYGANVLVVVLNDGAFGQTLMQQTNIYGHIYGTAFRSPHFADLAKACGCEGIRVTEPARVEEALRAGLAATKERPALVEVVVSDSAYPKL